MNEQIVGATEQEVAVPAENLPEEIDTLDAEISEESSVATVPEETGAANADNPEIAAGKATQSDEDNSKFAAIRRRMEAAEAKAKENESYKKSYDKLAGALASAYGIQGSQEDIIDKLTAGAKGISVEQARAERLAEEQRQKQSLENDPEYRRALAAAENYKNLYNMQRAEQLMNEDMRKLKEVHPEIKEVKLTDFDEDTRKTLGALLNAGWNIVDAYEAIDNRKNKTIKEIPPSVGSVTSTDTAVEKEYFTPEEARKLTRKQLDDPKVMAKVEKSMARWK